MNICDALKGAVQMTVFAGILSNLAHMLVTMKRSLRGETHDKSQTVEFRSLSQMLRSVRGEFFALWSNCFHLLLSAY